MAEIRLYVINSEKSKTIYTEDVLKEKSVDLKKMESFFGSDGSWKVITTKEPFLKSDDLKVKTLQRRKDPLTNRIDIDPNAFSGCLIQVGVTDWDLSYSKDEDGFNKMPVWMAEIVSALVFDKCYGGASDDPDFLKKLEEWQGQSSPPDTDLKTQE